MSRLWPGVNRKIYPGYSLGGLGGGGRINYKALGLVSDAYAYNNASSVQNIFYKTNGAVDNIDVFVPIADNKVAKYPFVLDASNYCLGGTLSEGRIETSDVLILKKTYDSRTGVWTDINETVASTTKIGATITMTFTGTGIDLYNLKNTLGGLWSFSIDGGDAIVLSCYSATAIYVAETITRDLEYGQHTIIGTFIGVDPEHVVATPKGYICKSLANNSVSTYHIYNKTESYVSENELQSAPNWLQFAISCKKFGASYGYKWFPYHGDITNTLISRSFKIDGVVISSFSDSAIKQCKEVVITHSYNCFNTNEPNLIHTKIDVVFKVNKYGLEVGFKLNVLVKLDVSAGYGFMLPWARAFCDQLTDSNNVEYSTLQIGGGATPIQNADTVRSIRLNNLTGSSELQKCELSAAFITPSVLRLGSTDRGYALSPYPVLFIENRDDATLNKFYCATFKDSIVEAGTSFLFNVIYYIGRKA